MWGRRQEPTNRDAGRKPAPPIGQPKASLDEQPIAAAGRVTQEEQASLTPTQEVMQSWQELPEGTREKLQNLFAEKQRLEGEIDSLEDEFRGLRKFLNFATRRLERTQKSLAKVEDAILELGREAVNTFARKQGLETQAKSSAQARTDRIVGTPRTNFGTSPAERAQARSAMDTLAKSRAELGAQEQAQLDRDRAEMTSRNPITDFGTSPAERAQARSAMDTLAKRRAQLAEKDE